MRVTHGGISDFISRRRDTRASSLSPHPHTPGKAMWAHHEKETLYNPGIQPSPGTKSASTLILDFQLPEL